MFCRCERAATSDSSDVRINHRADGARARGPRPEGPPEQNHIIFLHNVLRGAYGSGEAQTPVFPIMLIWILQ